MASTASLSLEGPTLCHLLIRHAETRPHALAYTELGGQGEIAGSLTYSELHLAVQSRARGLARRGLAGQRVVLAMPNGIDFVSTFFACLFAGAVPVVVMPPRRKANRDHLQAVLDDCSPELLVSPKPLQLGSGLAWSAGADLEEPGEPCPPGCSGGQLALLQYTSGSTSRPRGVRVTHDNIVANTSVIRDLLEQPEGATLVSWLPVYHDMGLISKVCQAVTIGGHLVMMSPASFLWKPYLWLKAISDFGAHSSGSPNFGFELCLTKIPAHEREQLNLSSWKGAFCAAEPVRRQTVERFGEVFASCGFQAQALRPAYGLAEATLCVTCRRGAASAPPYVRLSRDDLARGALTESEVGADFVNCGHTAGDNTILILHPETSQVLEEDQLGEIAVQGPTVADGYWGLAQHPSFLRRGDGQGVLLRTGDLGFLRRGELFIVGRLKSILIVAGRNIYPEDLEQTVESCHPAIRSGSSAAFALEREGQEQVIVALEMRGGERERLKKAVLEAVAREHGIAPYDVLFVAPGGLPRTTSGKLKRHQCGPDLAELVPRQDPSPEELEDPVERYLCEALAKRAGFPRVSPNVTFDRLGLSSLDRFTLMGELAEAIGLPVPADATWQHPTPRALAHFIACQGDQNLEVWRLAGGTPLIFVNCVAGTVGWARGLSKRLPKHLTLLALRQPLVAHQSLEELAAHQVRVLLERFGERDFSLVGLSINGRLAYEIARQLRQAGASVSLLAVLDTSGRPLTSLTFTEKLQQIPRVLRLGWARFQAEGLPALRDILKPRIRRWLGRPAARRRAPLYRHNMAQSASYVPKPYAGDLIVFRAKDQWMTPMFANKAGWEMVEGRVEIIDIPGTHRSIILRPHVDVLAAQLGRRLALRDQILKQ